MRQQSAVIQDWLGSPPYVFATANRKAYESDPVYLRASSSGAASWTRPSPPIAH